MHSNEKEFVLKQHAPHFDSGLDPLSKASRYSLNLKLCAHWPFALDKLMRAQWFQLCPASCNCMEHSPPDSSVHGILQARILEWVVVPSSRGSSQPRNGTCISYISCIAGGFFTQWATWEAHTYNQITPCDDCLYIHSNTIDIYV